MVKQNETVDEPDFVLFLDKDIRLAKHLERKGYRLFNTADAIETCDDKMATFQVLANHQLRMPKTLVSPMMYEGIGAPDDHFIDFIEAEFSYPLIVKEIYSSFGAGVYLVKNREQLEQKRKELLYTPHLYQEFIQTSNGKDCRLQVVGNEVVASMLRTSETDFRANITNGGVMHPFDPPQQFKDVAIEASHLVGADFAGVDILFGEDDEPIVCEINSNAHIKNIFMCTGVNVAERIIEYILKEVAYA